MKITYLSKESSRLSSVISESRINYKHRPEKTIYIPTEPDGEHFFGFRPIRETNDEKGGSKSLNGRSLLICGRHFVK